MKILLLEDDGQIANNIKKYLNLKMNYDVDIAFTIKEAKQKIDQISYDVLLFDVMLPDWESYDLANEIKQRTENIPIIFITAKWELEDKLYGFDSGWDDYITKPFELDELIARINAVAKRYWLGKFHYKWLDIDLDKRKVIKSWQEIYLNKTEFAILKYLLVNKWKVVEKTQLIDYVWWEDALWDWKVDRKLDVYIANLRKKLWKDFVETVKWVWYKV